MGTGVVAGRPPGGPAAGSRPPLRLMVRTTARQRQVYPYGMMADGGRGASTGSSWMAHGRARTGWKPTSGQMEEHRPWNGPTRSTPAWWRHARERGTGRVQVRARWLAVSRAARLVPAVVLDVVWRAGTGRFAKRTGPYGTACGVNRRLGNGRPSSSPVCTRPGWALQEGAIGRIFDPGDRRIGYASRIGTHPRRRSAVPCPVRHPFQTP